MEQLVDNLGSADVKLSEDESAQLDEVAPPNSVSVRYYDTAMFLDFRPHLGRW